MAKRVYVIHGFRGEPNTGWKPWLKKELEKKGFQVTIPAMPNTNNPNLKESINFLRKLIQNPDQNTFLIGHSLGAITILRYLETLPLDQKVGGVILLAGFSKRLDLTEFHPLNPFLDPPINWQKIRSHCQNFVAIHSDNDPYVPLENGQIFKEELAAKLIVMPGMGHFSSGEGTVKLPILLKEILQLG